MAGDSVEKFIRLLKKSPPGAVFNPWWQVDKQNDIGRNAPGIRRKQLGAYLRKRLGKTKLAVIGEAVGYRGGHFSGVPMTSERMLVGKKNKPPVCRCSKLSSIFFRAMKSSRLVRSPPYNLKSSMSKCIGFAILLPAAPNFFAGKSPGSCVDFPVVTAKPKRDLETRQEQQKL